MKGKVALAMLALGHLGRPGASTETKPVALQRPPRAVVSSAGSDPVASAIADLAKDWTPKVR